MAVLTGCLPPGSRLLASHGYGCPERERRGRQLEVLIRQVRVDKLEQVGR